MKLKSLTFALAALALPLGAFAESPAATEVAQPKAADTIDSLADETLNKLNQLVTILESVKDEASADKAAKDITQVGNDMLAISKRLSKLEKPSDEKKAELEKKFAVKEEEFGNRAGKAMKGMLEQKEELALKISEAMQAVGPQIREAGEVFEAYFGGSNAEG